MKKYFLLCVISIFLSSYVMADVGEVIPRTILALYKGSEVPLGIRYHPLHRCLEMPLNHAGLKVTYWDVDQGLPDVRKFPRLLGIISWFENDHIDKPREYLKWAIAQSVLGVKFLVIGNMGAYFDHQKIPVQRDLLENFFSCLGVTIGLGNIKLDQLTELFVKNKEYFSYEKKPSKNPIFFPHFKLLDTGEVPYLLARNRDEQTIVGHFSKNGGFIAQEYLMEIHPETGFVQWIIDPSEIIMRAFDTLQLPKADITTLDGNRIFFSHIDGDGWQSISQIHEYAQKKITCAQVIHERVLKRYAHLPVTVAPIAADLDPAWKGTQEAQNIARKIFSEPNVQPASHTYSHPLAWHYYDHEAPAEKELLDFGRDGTQKKENVELDGYKVPRAFFEHPYDLDNELFGSIKYIQQFVPVDKKVNLLQWSGDCIPPLRVLKRLSADKNIRNINGGDCRYDNDFPSSSTVCPVGRNVGGCIQVYAAGSNENTYTKDWTDKFFAFHFLKNTFEKTESPRRLKPQNVYYHMYSGEKLASLNAVISNLDYVSEQKIIPIDTVHYADIAQGFFSVNFVSQGQDRWQIVDRGALQTIRFDQASDKQVDYKASIGVIGARHYQGSLYVALDEAVELPLIVLSTGEVCSGLPKAEQPYLIESRWPIKDVAYDKQGVSFKAKGYGDAEFSWKMPAPGEYTLHITQSGKVSQQKITVTPACVFDYKGKISGLNQVEFKIMR